MSDAARWIITVGALIILLFGGFFVLNEYKKGLKSKYDSAQITFCTNTKDSSGNYLTYEQCWQYKEFLDGKFADNIDYEPTDY